jgi:hypothetical protein
MQVCLIVLGLLELNVNGGIAPIGFGDLLPGVAETLNWTQALMTLDRLELDPETINETLGTLLKYQDDIAKILGSEAAKILAEVKRELAAAG